MTREDANSSDVQEERQWISLSTGIGEMPFGRDELLTPSEAAKKREALRLFQQAYEAQMRDDLDAAADFYKESITVYPTAEAHTFLGWAYNFMGLTDEAIAECHRAIAVDPDFGNPYNDIGAYLIEQGNYHSAIEWLQCATRAVRYEPRFYPHFNLGRLHQAQGRYVEALDEYKTAIDLNPQYGLAIKAFRNLQGKLN